MKALRLVAVAVAALCLGVPAALAQESVDASRRNALVRAIEQAAPGVVSINVVEIRARRGQPMIHDFWEFFDLAPPQYRVEKRLVDCVGSGFVIDNHGHILTNSHVLEGADEVASVTLCDGRQLPAKVVGMDTRTDIAVLEVQDPGLKPVKLGDSSRLMTGEWVIAIGNPFGGLMGDPQPTASVGVVSANHRRISKMVGDGERLYQDMIQTDAAINPGNSGGPLVNALGEVVGVNTMIFSKSGGNVGLGFAIPINRAKRMAEELIQHGRRRDPWTGFKVENVQSLRREFREQLGIRTQSGCLVVNILRDSPAYEGGLRPGDVIVGMNGNPVVNATDIDFVTWGLFVGDEVTLTFDREGREKVITFEVVELNS